MPAINISTTEQITDGRDSIVHLDRGTTLPGGRSLDATGFAPTVIPAGHIIIRETATGVFKPMPVTGSAYDALPTGHTYYGLLQASVATAKPFASIRLSGVSNSAAMLYNTSSILTAFVAAVPTIRLVVE